MADKLNIEIGGRLVPLLLRLARRQGREPDEIKEEALLRYVRWLGLDEELDPDIGRQIGEVYVESPDEPTPARDGFLALLDRMSSRFDLDDPDEAMRIAVEEQHAFRSERAERQREDAGR